MSSDRTVLLFLHGGGFNKETWQPVIRRVQASSLLHTAPCEIQAIDWPFHGSQADHSTPATVWYDGPTKKWPRVDHPAKHWPQWAPEALYKHIQSIRSQHEATRIVVVAHSMGATAAMIVEMTYPGTLDGLVAFEPICNGNMAPEMCVVAANVMVANTLAREAHWSSWEAVVSHFTTTKMYRKWHSEAMEAYLVGGVRESFDGFTLSMPPAQEAALYSYDIAVVTFPMEAYARMKCPVVFEYGDKTTLFGHDIMQEVAAMYPSRFSVSKPIKNTGHLMILEDPEACAHRIVTTLAKFPVFKDRLKPAAINSRL